MTITEALAEMKTLAKRVEKKREAIAPYLLRPSMVIDPLTDQGGSKEFVRREFQALDDLERRMVAIRTSIQQVNLTASLAVEGETKTIAAWLTWRKEIAAARSAFLGGLRATIVKTRAEYGKRGGTVTENAKPDGATVVVNLDELALTKEIEQLATILGTLDGQLSLKNATTVVPGV